MDMENFNRFFYERFNRLPSEDPVYSEEWIQRIESGHPETWADSETLPLLKKYGFIRNF